MKKELFYFSTSALIAATKTTIYGLAIPYATREYLTGKNPTQHKKDLIDIIENIEEDETPEKKESLKKAVNYGDLFGLFSTFAIVFPAIAIAASYDERVIQIPIFTNGISACYEALRAGWIFAEKINNRKR